MEDIYSNPLSDARGTDFDHGVSFATAREIVASKLSTSSSSPLGSIKTCDSISKRSNGCLSVYHNDSEEVNNNEINNDNNGFDDNIDENVNGNDEIYSKLKSKAIHNEHGPVEYVYSLVDKDNDKCPNKLEKGKNKEEYLNADEHSVISDKNKSIGKNETIKKTFDDYSIIPDSDDKLTKPNDVYESISEADDKKNVTTSKSQCTENFYAVFLGSTLVDLALLKQNKANYVADCIWAVAGLTSAATTLNKKSSKDSQKKVTLSENRGMSVMMRMEGSFLRVLERETSKTRLLIGLNNIRMWGVGKDKNSRELAIISKDEEVQNVLCRVFLCEKEATIIAKSFYSLCHELAEKKRKNNLFFPKSTTSLTHGQNSVEKKSSFNLFKNKNDKNSGERKKEVEKTKPLTQNTLPLPSTNSVTSTRSILSDGYQPSNNHEISCSYLGMMEVQKASGLKTIEHVVEMMKKYVAEENWLQGTLRCSSSGVFFVHDSSTRLSCSCSDITFTSVSFKHKNFLAIMVSRQAKLFVHVFIIEDDCIMWFETMKFVCLLHSSKYPKTDFTLKKWK